MRVTARCKRSIEKYSMGNYYVIDVQRDNTIRVCRPNLRDPVYYESFSSFVHHWVLERTDFRRIITFITGITDTERILGMIASGNDEMRELAFTILDNYDRRERY